MRRSPGAPDSMSALRALMCPRSSKFLASRDLIICAAARALVFCCSCSSFTVSLSAICASFADASDASCFARNDSKSFDNVSADSVAIDNFSTSSTSASFRFLFFSARALHFSSAFAFWSSILLTSFRVVSRA